MRNNLEKLKELVAEKGSRTLIRNLMASTESATEDKNKTNEDLILQMNESEGLLETEWLKKIQAEVFNQITEAPVQFMGPKDEPASEVASQRSASVRSTTSSRIEAKKSAERTKLELESLQRKKEIELLREKERNRVEEEKLHMYHEQEQKKQSIEQEERQPIMQAEAQLEVEETWRKHYTAQMELQVEDQASCINNRNEVSSPPVLERTMAMLDSGSNATLIHQDLVHQLGFSGGTKQLQSWNNSFGTIQEIAVSQDNAEIFDKYITSFSPLPSPHLAMLADAQISHTKIYGNVLWP